jgi:tetratricopeptide (TPR) repeat protein
VDYFNRGLFYRANGNLDQAIADFSKSIEIDPNNSEAYRKRGAAYQDKSLLDLASADFNQADKLGLLALTKPGRSR